MSRNLLHALVLAVVLPVCSGTAHAADLCLKLASSGEQFVLKQFALPRGKSAAVGGYANIVGVSTVLQSPVSGRAIASSKGDVLVLGLTKYFAEVIHDSGSSANINTSLAAASATYAMTFNAGPGAKVGPGVVGASSLLQVDVGSGVTQHDDTATILDCGKKDNGLTLP